jgi:hypothetical protein
VPKYKKSEIWKEAHELIIIWIRDIEVQKICNSKLNGRAQWLNYQTHVDVFYNLTSKILRKSQFTPKTYKEPQDVWKIKTDGWCQLVYYMKKLKFWMMYCFKNLLKVTNYLNVKSVLFVPKQLN